MPGYANCFDDIFDSNIALPIARQHRLGRGDPPGGGRRAGPALRGAGVRIQAAHPGTDPGLGRDGRRRADVPEALPAASWPPWRTIAWPRPGRSTALERDLAALLVQTPYVLLLGIPGINVVSAAEFAGEMGPIEHYASARAITGRAGLFPVAYQSDQVDRAGGPLVRCGNRGPPPGDPDDRRQPARCNDHFRGLAAGWREAGQGPAGHPREGRRAGSAGSPTRWWPAAGRSATPAASGGTLSSKK